MAVPLIPELRVGLPGPRVRAAIAAHRTDLVHLAGPFVLGASAAAAAKTAGLPMVAVYATDMPAYARAYHAGRAGRGGRLAAAAPDPQRRGPDAGPVHATAAELHAHGVQRVWLWGRGVDTAGSTRPGAARGCGPSWRRAASCSSATSGGWPPRSASTLLAEVAALPGVRLVDRRQRPGRGRGTPGPAPAVFLGQRGGDAAGRDLRQPGRVRAQRAARHVRPDAAGGRGQRAAGGRAGRRRPDRPGRTA